MSDIYTWKPGKFEMFAGGVIPGDNNPAASILGTIIPIASLGQATTFTVPDPGAAAANFVLDTGTQTLGGNYTFTNPISVPNGLLFTSILLTPANLKAMYATPVAVPTMPAVTGKSYVVNQVLYRYTYGTAVYADGGVIGLQYGNTANGAGIIPCTPATAALLTTGSSADQIGGSSGTINTGTLGTAMYVSNQTAAFISATGTGTLLLNIWYMLL